MTAALWLNLAVSVIGSAWILTLNARMLRRRTRDRNERERARMERRRLFEQSLGRTVDWGWR